MMKDVIVTKHHCGREDVRNITQQEDEAVAPDSLEDEIVSGVMDEDPESVVDDSSDGVTDEGGGPDGEVFGGGDGDEDLEDDEGEGP